MQDFFSIVQLGVGIHAGTAILQLSGELGVGPVERRVNSLQLWLEEEKAEIGEKAAAQEKQLEEFDERLSILRTDISIYRVRYERLYRRSIYGTFGFAGGLSFTLAIMSFLADSDISIVLGLLLVLLCFVPATLIFANLWQVSSNALTSIRQKVTDLENRLVQPGG